MSGCCGGKAAVRYMTPEEEHEFLHPMELQGEGATAYVPATEHVWLQVPDTTAREQYPSGMVRNSRKGKGRFDLISPYALRRLARVMEEGIEQEGYEDRNWEKGCPGGRFLDSCMRHLGQWRMGETDEDHLGRAFWNLHCIVHFDEIEYGQTPDAENLTSSKGWHE